MQTIQKLSTWFSNQKRGGKLAIGCGGGFMVFCLCLFMAVLVTPPASNAEAASTPVDVVSLETSAFETALAGVYQTATANPTITAFPTDTQVPSTATFPPSPIPSATLPPPATPDAYERSISEKVPAYAEAFFEVLAYNQEVADDISLLFDTSWKIKQGFALGQLELRADEMAALQPTPDYVTLHSIIVQLTSETHLFADAYTRGVDQLDADQIYQATLHIENMNGLMEQATAEIKRITASP